MKDASHLAPHPFTDSRIGASHRLLLPNASDRYSAALPESSSRATASRRVTKEPVREPPIAPADHKGGSSAPQFSAAISAPPPPRRDISIEKPNGEKAAHAARTLRNSSGGRAKKWNGESSPVRSSAKFPGSLFRERRRRGWPRGTGASRRKRARTLESGSGRRVGEFGAAALSTPCRCAIGIAQSAGFNSI